MSGSERGGDLRKHEMEIEIDATPDEVWQALSTAKGIESWFAPTIRVEPGVGGSVFMSWGPGMEGTERIDVWEPGRHLRIGHDRAEGAPPAAVDYYIEAKGGTTVMRLVHSGFTADASFDNEFESTATAWPVFLQMLKHSVEQGTQRCRNVTIFRMLNLSRDESWAKLTGPDGPCAEPNLSGIVRYRGNGVLCVVLPERRGDMLSVFCEKAGPNAMLTITWLLYGVGDAEADAIRVDWSEKLDRLFGA